MSVVASPALCTRRPIRMMGSPAERAMVHSVTISSRAAWMAGAVFAAAAIATAAGSDRAGATSPKVLRVYAAGYGVAVDPETVQLGIYTAQVHNIGQYPVLVTIGPRVKVWVPPNGWRFPKIAFTRAG